MSGDLPILVPVARSVAEHRRGPMLIDQLTPGRYTAGQHLVAVNGLGREQARVGPVVHVAGWQRQHVGKEGLPAIPAQTFTLVSPRSAIVRPVWVAIQTQHDLAHGQPGRHVLPDGEVVRLKRLMFVRSLQILDGREMIGPNQELAPERRVVTDAAHLDAHEPVWSGWIAVPEEAEDGIELALRQGKLISRTRRPIG